MKRIYISKGLLVLLVAYLTSKGLKAEDVRPSLFSQVSQGQTVSNCAVSTAAFTLDYFAKPFQISKLAAALETNSSWDQAVDMLHLKKNLTLSGLHVTAFKDATLADIGTTLSGVPNAIAVLFLRNRFGDVGHYVILIPKPSGNFVLVDPESAPEFTSLSTLNTRFGQLFSGTYLLLKDQIPQAEKAIDFGSGDIALDVGQIPPGHGILNASFWMKNPKDTPIVFQNSVGGCSCFKGVTVEGGDGKTIPPHDSRRIDLAFDKNLLAPGPLKREVAISFQSESLSWTKVSVSGTVPVRQLSVQLEWYPKKINLGLVRNADTAKSRKLVIMVPPGVELGEPKMSAVGWNIHLMDSKDEKDDYGRAVRQYEVAIPKMLTGEVHERFSVTTTDPSVASIVVEIDGDFGR